MKRVRTRRKTPNKKPRSREPLAEGIRKRKPRGFYKNMSDGELVAFTKIFVKEKWIRWRGELQKVDAGLYVVLRKRKLLDRVGFEERRRDWRSFSDAQLVEHAKKFMEENGISGRKELQKADGGLYKVLRERKLLDRVGFEEKIRKSRKWSSFSDAQLVEHIKQFMEERGISGRAELYKADQRLYDALWKRKLLDKVGFEEKRRPNGFFSNKSDEELVVFAKKVVEEKKIMSRWGLGKDDKVLYEALRIRKLLDRVFAPIEQAKEREEIQQIVEGLQEFSN